MESPLADSQVEQSVVSQLQQVSCPLHLRTHVFSAAFQGSKAVKRTILVTQSTDDNLPKPEWSVVIGLVGIEYPEDFEIKANRGLVYLQYVDTTGTFEPRQHQKHLTKALVLGYLRACQSAGFSRCQIFARANPSYLFGDSERNPSKRVLSDSQLITWWAKTLAAFPSAKSHFLLAGEPENSPEVRKLKDHLPAAWIYGPPAPASTRACDIIPLFPDDQKAVLLRGLSKEERQATTVDDFFQRLALSQPSRMAFFFLELKDPSVTLEITPAKDGDGKADKEATPKDAGEDPISASFQSHRFGSPDEAKKSTVLLLDELKQLQGVSHRKFLFKKDQSTVPEEEVKEKVTRPPPVNNLQGLIKRKKVEAGSGGKK